MRCRTSPNPWRSRRCVDADGAFGGVPYARFRCTWSGLQFTPFTTDDGAVPVHQNRARRLCSTWRESRALGEQRHSPATFCFAPRSLQYDMPTSGNEPGFRVISNTLHCCRGLLCTYENLRSAVGLVQFASSSFLSKIRKLVCICGEGQGGIPLRIVTAAGARFRSHRARGDG